MTSFWITNTRHVASLLLLINAACAVEAASSRARAEVGAAFLQLPGNTTAKRTHKLTHNDPKDEVKSRSGDSNLVQMALRLNTIALACMGTVVLKVACTHAPISDAVPAHEDKSISQALPTVVTWCLLGMCLVCFNKYMYMSLDEGGFGFPFPMALTWWHMFTAFVMTNLLLRLRPDLMPAARNGDLDLRGILTAIVPIGVVFAGYLCVGNVTYLYLSVSFIQMLKSAGPIGVHILSCAVGLERMQISTIFTVSAICLGVAGASIGEVAFSWTGFALQFLAFFLDALRMVLLKTLMSSKGRNLDSLSGLYYYSPVCVMVLSGPVAYFEGRALLKGLGNAPAWFFLVLIVNGLVAFALNFCLLALFRVASPTTISVGSVVRDIVSVFGAAWLFHTPLTRVQVVGYLVAVLGVKLWDHIKSKPRVFEKAIIDPITSLWHLVVAPIKAPLNQPEEASCKATKPANERTTLLPSASS